MQAGWKEQLIERGVTQDINHLALLRVDTDADCRAAAVRFTLDRLPDEQLMGALHHALGGMLPGVALSVHVSCPALMDRFLADPAAFAPQLTAMLKARMPACASHLSKAQWAYKNASVTLTLPSAMAVDYMQSRGCEAALARLIREVFGALVPVKFIEVGQDPEELLRAFAKKREKFEQELLAQMPAPQEKKQMPDQPLYGRHFGGVPIKLCDIHEQTGRCVIEGQILTCEKIRPKREGAKLILNFAVTDFTNTLLCKIFIEPEHENTLSGIQKNSFVRVRGAVGYDTYLRDLSMVVSDVMPSVPEERTDDEPEKRIELHMHTHMSDMDAIALPEELIARAAKWGHEAVAITDHGVVQAFPDAFGAAKKHGIRLIPGMEGYLTDDTSAIVENSGTHSLDEAFVVVDLEMTGAKAGVDRIIEIGAVKWQGGKITDEFVTLVDPHIPIPEKIQKLTGITDAMVLGAPPIEQAIEQFCAFAGDCPICAHDVHIDIAFLRAALPEDGSLCLSETLIDTLALSRALIPDAKAHKLEALCKQLGIPLTGHHRAIADARATGELFARLYKMLTEQGIHTLSGVNAELGLLTAAKSKSFHIILLAKNNKGLENLYRLVSYSHLDYFSGKPRLPRTIIERHREGLIVGSACEAGELYQAVLNGKSEADLLRTASFYDFLEIQPLANNAFMIRNGMIKSEETLKRFNRRIVELGEKLEKPVVATGDVHFLEPRDALLREILMTGIGFDDAAQQAPLYFKTTREMLEDFDYLGDEMARQVVIHAPKQILSMCEPVTLFPKHPENKPTFQPDIEGAAEKIESMSWSEAKKLYGDPLPEIVQKRLEKELKSIIGHGFATLYYSAHLLVKKSNEDGYLVGSRGSVGSSFVATMCGITEVNPLAPHYRCPQCRHSEFDIDVAQYPIGVDLPPKDCPECGHPLLRDGFEIPFEVFLGFEGDKVPDIDLNFSGEYQAKAHAYVEELFGSANVFRAGTISSLGDKKAFGYVKGFIGDKGLTATNAEVDRLVAGITNVKKNTGQHPGGMVIVPKEYEIYQFCPIQNPADKAEKGIVTTHFDFNSLHDLLVKLDILGHDDPTMIRMLEELTQIPALSLPLNDPDVMSLFRSPEALGLTEKELGFSKGTLGIPEFGTKFVIGMLEDTLPTTVGELVRISGLSHGTDVWLGNAQDLIRANKATLRQCICTRDDIMELLISVGMESKMAFNIMESVRKGKGLTADMEQAIRAVPAPDWYIDSCKKIQYMFPKGHAVAYVTMALRVAWYKVYQPLAYYTAYFTVRADEFDAALMCRDVDSIRTSIRTIHAMGKNASDKDEKVLTQLELVLEMLLRGLAFAPIDLYRSHPTRFQIVDGKILPSLNALGGVGGAAAQAIADAREGGPFLSVEDLRQRSRVSKAVLDTLRLEGALGNLPDTNQMTLF